MTDVIAPNSSQRIEIILLDSSRAAVTGATVTLKIRRKSDGKYFNGTSFQTLSATVSMSEVSAVNDAGKYYYDFATSGFPDDEYYLTAASASGANVPQVGSFRTGVVPTNAALVPVMAGAGDSVWTKEEKDRVLQQVKKILSLSEEISNRIGEESASFRENALQESEKILAKLSENDSLVKNLAKDISYLGKLDVLEAGVRASIEKFSAVLVESMTARFAEHLEKISEAVAKLDATEKLQEIQSGVEEVQDIVIRTAPTQVLEELDNED